MTAQTLYPDVAGDFRSWLRTHPYLTDLQAARVFFRIPGVPNFPLTQMSLLDDTNQDGQAPIVNAMIGLTVWGGSYADVTNIANGIKAACHEMNPGTAIGTSTIGLNAELIGSVDSPDPDDGRPRKVLTVSLTARRRAVGE